MAHRTHFAVEKLSEEGRRLVHDRAGKNWTYEAVVTDLKLITGEELSISSLARYLSSKEARDRIEEAIKTRIREEVMQSGRMAESFISAVKDGDFETAEMGRALIQEAIFANRLKLQDADPLQLAKAEQEQQKLDLKRQELALRTREIEFNERKLAQLEAKQKAIEEKVSKAVAPENHELTEAEKAKIRSIYGL